MAFTPIGGKQLSDLIFHDYDPSLGYTRRDIVVQGTGTLEIGDIVFRAKSVTHTAPYAKLSADTALVATNEFAIVFGDQYGCTTEWPITAAATAVNSVAFVQGPLFVKDELIIEQTSYTRGSANYLKLKELLEQQGIILEKTL